MSWVPNYRLSLRVSLPLTIAVLLALPLAGWGQQELRSGKKGVTAPAPVTSTSVDADTQALDVAIKAGSINLSGADGAILDGVTPSIKATVKNYTNSKPLTVVTVDTNGDPVSAGGGTQYTEDAASVADPVGTQTICRRRDTLATETSADGDNTAVNCTGKGELYVKHIDPIAVTQSGIWTIQQGTPPWAMKPDGTVWTLTGTSANVAVTNSVAVTGTFWQAIQPISGTVGLTPSAATGAAYPSTVVGIGLEDSGGVTRNPRGFDLDTGAPTAYGLAMTWRKSGAGAPEFGTSADPVRIDPTGTTTQPISAASLPLPTGAATLAEQQTQTTALQLLDNISLPQSAATAGQSGVLHMGAVTTSAPTYTTGNTNPISLQTDGSQRVAVTNTPAVTQSGTWNIGTITTLPALPANQSVNVAQINGVTPLMGNGTTGTGSPRVTIASDNTPFSVNAVQSTPAATTAPWPVSNGTVARTSASWTSATPVDTALTISTGGFAVVGLTTNTTTTITAGTLQFEASDDSGTTWFSVSCTAIGSSISLAAYPMSASTKLAWQCPIAGYDRMRVRINPALTGTGQVTVGLTGSASGEVSGVTSSTNIVNVVGNTAATAATGTLKVGIVGSAAGAFDAANNAAAPANVLVVGAETATQGTTQPTAATAGNMRRPVSSTDGAIYTRLGGPVTWSCGLDGISTTLTQCQAAPSAGLKLYVTDVVAQSTTATAGQFLLRQGTGTNCGTGTASILPSAATVVRLAAPANTVQPAIMQFATPIALTAANALCVLGVATNTVTIQINGYTAP